MPKTVEKIVCCHCGESLNSTKFYKSYSSFYKNSLLPICKDCFAHKFGEYAKTYKSNKMAIQRMCMSFDIYFDEDLFDSCDVNDDTVIGNYFRKLNMSQYRGRTFENSLENGILNLSGDRKRVKGKRVAVVDEYDNVQEETEDIKINPKDVEKWGIGLEPEDYNALTSHYKYLKAANPDCDSNQEIFINDLCYTKMLQLKALKEGRGDDFAKLTESYRKTFAQAGLKVVKDSNSTEDFTVGVNAEQIEKYTPAEYYKDKKLYKDYDNIGGYFERFILRPLRNLQFGTKDRDYEFYVKDEESEGFDEDE